MTMPPYPQNGSPEPPRRTRKRWLWITGAAVAVLAVLVVGITMWVMVTGGGTGSRPPAAPSGAPVPAAAPSSTEPPAPDPTAADFTIDPKIKSQQCFGEAGCNVVVFPDLTYNGDADLSEKTCDVTYEISGDQSGPVIDTLETTDDENYSASNTMLDTASSSTSITVKVTDVSCMD